MCGCKQVICGLLIFYHVGVACWNKLQHCPSCFVAEGVQEVLFSLEDDSSSSTLLGARRVTPLTSSSVSPVTTNSVSCSVGDNGCAQPRPDGQSVWLFSPGADSAPLSILNVEELIERGLIRRCFSLLQEDEQSGWIMLVTNDDSLLGLSRQGKVRESSCINLQEPPSISWVVTSFAVSYMRDQILWVREEYLASVSASLLVSLVRESDEDDGGGRSRQLEVSNHILQHVTTLIIMITIRDRPLFFICLYLSVRFLCNRTQEEEATSLLTSPDVILRQFSNRLSRQLSHSVTYLSNLPLHVQTLISSWFSSSVDASETGHDVYGIQKVRVVAIMIMIIIKIKLLLLLLWQYNNNSSNSRNNNEFICIWIWIPTCVCLCRC